MTRPIKVSIVVGSLLILLLLTSMRWQEIFSDQSIKSSQNINSGVANEINTKSERPVVAENAAENTKKILGKNNQEVEWVGDQAQLDQVANWRAERGWYDTSGENQDDYKTYSEDTLKQLAENGDLKALHLLAREAPEETSKQLLTKAAVYGSTFALFNLGNHVIAYGDITKNDTEEKKKPVLIEAAAYMVIASMRGDLLSAKYMGIGSLESRFNAKFNSTDLELATARAQEIYNSLESERIALGLGKFDDSIPPVVQARFKSSGIDTQK